MKNPEIDNPWKRKDFTTTLKRDDLLKNTI